jgi:hypothetical protein
MNAWDKLNNEMDTRLSAAREKAAANRANKAQGGQKKSIPAGGGFYKPPGGMAGKPPMNRKPPTP